MQFEASYPIHPYLQKHIRYYYFVKTTDKNHHSAYYSFPNITIPINIHKNVDCTIQGNKIIVTASDNENYITIANGLRENPLLVEWIGLIDKVTIAFTASGINHFIKNDLNKVVDGYGNIFTEWEGNNYNLFLKKFYATDNISERVTAIEKFLLTIYQPFEKNVLLEKATDLLSDFNAEKTIPEIANALNVSERTFTRMFKTHIGVSPVIYRKIARFRQSLENKVVKEKFKRFTEIGYESNYYDQAYFIKMYNKLSGKSPKDLYKSVQKLADDNVIFEFLENTIDFG